MKNKHYLTLGFIFALASAPTAALAANMRAMMPKVDKAKAILENSRNLGLLARMSAHARVGTMAMGAGFAGMGLGTIAMISSAAYASGTVLAGAVIFSTGALMTGLIVTVPVAVAGGTICGLDYVFEWGNPDQVCGIIGLNREEQVDISQND